MKNWHPKIEVLLMTIQLEEAIYVLPREMIRAQRCGVPLKSATYGNYDIPSDAPNSVPQEHYHGYRRGKVGACADVIVWTRTSDGTPAAILTLRKEGVCFEKKWWMQGGAVDAFAPITDFTARCAKRECGSSPTIEALVGFFRTTEFEAEERRQVSTIQSAYIGYVSPDALHLKADEGHTSVVLMGMSPNTQSASIKDGQNHHRLNGVSISFRMEVMTEALYASVIPEKEKHWYPSMLMEILFSTMP